jgi:hypothetical protein
MGDRCYMQINCRASDADNEELKELFPERWEPDTDGEVQLWDSEANYAYGVAGGDFGDLPQGIPFYGHHSEGGDYSPGVFATDGNTIAYALGSDGNYSIRFDVQTGEPNQQDLAEVKNFIIFYNKVREMIRTVAAADHTTETAAPRPN